MARLKRIETLILSEEDKQVLMQALNIASEIFGAALPGTPLEELAKNLKNDICDFIHIAEIEV